jgi:hypothetical protein
MIEHSFNHSPIADMVASTALGLPEIVTLQKHSPLLYLEAVT